MNFQNIPRSDKTVKRGIVPKLDALLFFDYKNIEPRLLAYYLAMLGDKSLANVFERGEDIYVALARPALAIYDRDLTDEERQVGKVLYLSICYGGGAPTVMRQLNVSFPEARGILDSFHENMPGVRLLQRSIEVRLQERGYITTLFGRHLRPLEDRKALNALIQGCAADLMRSALVKVHRGLGEQACTSHMISVIHDEIILDAIDAEVPRLVELVPGWMRDERVHTVVPILVDCEISRTTWADKTEYREEVAV